MSAFTAPVSMIVPSGKGAALAAAVLALVLVLAYTSRRDPNSSQSTPQR